jgi:hypothetical protein
MKLPPTPIFFRLTLLASLLVCLCAALLYQVTRPHFGQGKVEFPGLAAQDFVYPFLQKRAPKARFVLKENIELGFLYPTVFRFYPQDILWGIKINGHDVAARGLPLSVSNHEGRSIDLAPFLHPGSNQIELDMEVNWGEASLRACVSPWDKYSLIFSALFLTGIIGMAAYVYSYFGMCLLGSELFILLGGFLLRYIYLLGTPYFIRAYDYWGHADYLDYVTQHLSLPAPHSNWEAYQPPLYYFLVSAMTKLCFLGGMTEEQRYGLWQGFSLLCSTGVLLVGFWIARLLYANEPEYRLYLLAVIGVAPALVFNASRVSNDVLLNLLDFLWFALLLEFWQRPNERAWFGLTLILGLALLTKASALVLIPISILCLILTPNFGVRSKIFAALTLIVVSFGIGGWYYLPRAFHEAGVGTYMVGNLSTLNPKAHIDGIFAKSLVFNPFKVLRYPFAEPWGPRHEYFLEVFFKTIFLGEWIRGISYRWLARALTLTALLLIPAFILGLYRSMRERGGSTLPLLITLVAVFFAHWNFVQVAPFISSQDFRYSVILLIPMVFFFIQGVSTLAPKWGRTYRFGLQLVILNSGIYLFELALEG